MTNDSCSKFVENATSLLITQTIPKSFAIYQFSVRILSWKLSKVFQTEDSTTRETSSIVRHLIHTEHANPRRSPPQKRGYSRHIIENMKGDGVIERVTYETLGKCKMFSTLDLKSDYCQVQPEPKDKCNTTFTNRTGFARPLSYH
ncbi:hypothetical protein Trydic_g16195 [Trypoxylus dichotomus]